MERTWILWCIKRISKNKVIKKQDREKNVEKIIRQTWTSLESHLAWTYKKSSEGKKFHKTAVKEYLDIMNNAVKLW